jgi:PRTRC genetic system protein C
MSTIVNTVKRTYVYGNMEMQYDSSKTPEEVRRIWASIYPDLLNANITERPDGSVEFTERPGMKGL